MRYLLIVLLFGGLVECVEHCDPPPPRADAGTDSGVTPQWCYTPYRAHGGPVNNVCFASFDECMRVRAETMIRSSECFAFPY
jgi:hypothetical protein